MTTFTLYNVTHTDTETIKDDNIVLLHVGADNSEKIIDGALADNTGINISEKNDSFCELTGIYWVWKNAPKTDYVGFMHYRRHFDFRPSSSKKPSKWGMIEYNNISEEYVQINGLDSKNINKIIDNHDIILPKKWDVTNAGSKNLLDHFQNGESHAIQDLDITLSIIKQKYPEYSKHIKPALEQQAGYFTNMFIMKWDIFNEYCEWLFDILFEVEKTIDISEYNTQERRIFGFISEWLLNIFIEKLNSNVNPPVISEYNRTYVKNTKKKPAIKPHFFDNKTAIVLAFNDNYTKYASALISSIKHYSKYDKKYDIIVFTDDVSRSNITKVNSIIRDKENFSIRFYDVSPYFWGMELKTHGHFSKETYYRLKIPTILKEYDRVIYIDSDTVVLRDILDLEDVDLGENLVAATRDIVMAGFRKYKTPSTSQTGKLEAEQYLKKYLNMTSPEKYFQAGIIVFDVNRLNASTYENDISKALTTKNYWFLDQDILNIVLDGKVKLIDQRWNALFGNGDLKTFFSGIAAQDRKEFFAALDDPFMLHFAGERKPWLYPTIEHGHHFWTYLRSTPYYEEVLALCLGLDQKKLEAPHPRLVLGENSASKSSFESVKMSLKIVGYMIWPVGKRRKNKRRAILASLKSFSPY